MAENPTLWEQPGQAQKILKERNKLQQALNNYQQLKNQLADNIGLIELAEQENEADILQEAEKSLADLQDIARKRKACYRARQTAMTVISRFMQVRAVPRRKIGRNWYCACI